MSVQTGISYTAEDQKKGMTLKELRDFVEQVAYKGIDDDALVKVTHGWGGQVEMMRVEEVKR
jgi:hypothetical protein